MLGQDFYHSVIRKNISLFGVLFDNINISRTDKNGVEIQKIRVPLSYAPKDKMLSRLFGDPKIDREAAVQLPRMSFEMGAPMFDVERKMNPLNKIVNCSNTNISANQLNMMYQPVPYIFPFTLYVYGNNAEDCAKIVEQIYPRFQPDWTLSVEPLEDLPQLRLDYPIIMGQSTVEDTFEGSLLDRRRIVWSFQFMMRGYMFGPIKSKPVIKYVIGNSRLFGTTEDITRVTVQPGLTANGEPTSNVAISIPVADIQASDPYGYVQINSGVILNE